MQGIAQTGIKNGNRFVGTAVIIQNQAQGKEEYAVNNLSCFVSVLGKEQKHKKYDKKVLYTNIPAEIIYVHNRPE